MAAAPHSVEAYLAGLNEDQRALLMEVRRLIRSTAPEAEESMAYAMPAYRYRGKPLVYFGAARNHWALYGAGGDAYPEVSKRFETSKGTIRFPWDEAVPADIVEMVVRDRMTNIDAQPAKGRKGASKRTREEAQ